MRTRYSKPSLSKMNNAGLNLPSDVFTDLLRASLEKGSLIRFQATGWSMSPFIKDGDLLTILPFNEKAPRIGQVVAFIQPHDGNVLVHRIISKHRQSCLIKGDNTPGRHDGLIPIENILGFVEKINRKGRDVRFGLGVERIPISLLSRINFLVPILTFLKVFRQEHKAASQEKAQQPFRKVIDPFDKKEVLPLPKIGQITYIYITFLPIHALPFKIIYDII